jgi:hypothetical protein
MFNKPNSIICHIYQTQLTQPDIQHRLVGSCGGDAGVVEQVLGVCLKEEDIYVLALVLKFLINLFIYFIKLIKFYCTVSLAMSLFSY